MSNPFYINKGPFNISVLLKLLNSKTKIEKDQQISDIKDLVSAETNCITFFHSKKYRDLAKKTKASYCITTDNFREYLPSQCKSIIVENVLIATSLITAKFYPNSVEDEFDNSVNNIEFDNFICNIIIFIC